MGRSPGSTKVTRTTDPAGDRRLGQYQGQLASSFAHPNRNPTSLQKAWNNIKDFVGGGASGAVDAGKGMWQLGYDTFYGASPFGDEQTQAETKARAQVRGELIKHPAKLVDAVKAPYEQDIATGHDGRAAGRAVFDIASIIGTGGGGATAKAGSAASTTSRQHAGAPHCGTTRRRRQRSRSRSRG